MKKFLLASVAVALTTFAYAAPKKAPSASSLLSASQSEAMKKGCVVDVKAGLQAEAEALGITNTALLNFDLKSVKPLVKGGSAPAEAAKECMAQVKAAYTKGVAPTSKFVNVTNPAYAAAPSPKFNWSSAAADISEPEGAVDESGHCVCPRIAPVSSVAPTAAFAASPAAVIPTPVQPMPQVADAPVSSQSMAIQPVAAPIAAATVVASPAPAAVASAAKAPATAAPAAPKRSPEQIAKERGYEDQGDGLYFVPETGYLVMWNGSEFAPV